MVIEEAPVPLIEQRWGCYFCEEEGTVIVYGLLGNQEGSTLCQAHYNQYKAGGPSRQALQERARKMKPARAIRVPMPVDAVLFLSASDLQLKMFDDEGDLPDDFLERLENNRTVVITDDNVMSFIEAVDSYDIIAPSIETWIMRFTEDTEKEVLTDLESARTQENVDEDDEVLQAEFAKVKEDVEAMQEIRQNLGLEEAVWIVRFD